MEYAVDVRHHIKLTKARRSTEEVQALRADTGEGDGLQQSQPLRAFRPMKFSKTIHN